MAVRPRDVWDCPRNDDRIRRTAVRVNPSKDVDRKSSRAFRIELAVETCAPRSADSIPQLPPCQLEKDILQIRRPVQVPQAWPVL